MQITRKEFKHRRNHFELSSAHLKASSLRLTSSRWLVRSVKQWKRALRYRQGSGGRVRLKLLIRPGPTLLCSTWKDRKQNGRNSKVSHLLVWLQLKKWPNNLSSNSVDSQLLPLKTNSPICKTWVERKHSNYQAKLLPLTWLMASSRIKPC